MEVMWFIYLGGCDLGQDDLINSIITDKQLNISGLMETSKPEAVEEKHILPKISQSTD